MSTIIRRGPSPSMLVAGAALVVAVAGTAIAGPLATKSVLTKPERKQVKKLARSEIKKAAPRLSVANASTVDGANASDLRTTSGFNHNDTAIPSLSGTFVDVAAATITTQSSGRILATGSAELVGATQDEVGRCRIQIVRIGDAFGPVSAFFDSAPDDIGDNNEFVIAVSFAATRPAGTYTAKLQCAANGTVGKEEAEINVYGLGA